MIPATQEAQSRMQVFWTCRDHELIESWVLMQTAMQGGQ